MILTGFAAIVMGSLCLVIPAIILFVLIVTLRGRDNNPLAVLSVVTGILGLILLPIVGSIAAVVSGNIALAQYRDIPEPAGGSNTGLAKAGVILGWIGIAIWVVGVIGVVLFLVPASVVTTG